MPTPTAPIARNGSVASLWLGVLGCPIVWAIHLQVLYALVIVAKHQQQAWMLYLTTGVCAVLTLAFGLVSYGDWRRVQADRDDVESSSPAGRTRFMSVIGICFGAFFTLTILATGLAAYFLKANWV